MSIWRKTRLGVGVVQDQVVDVVVAEALKLLEVVVVVEAHPALPCELADLVEDLAATQHEVAVAVGEELDVAAELGVAEFGLVVQGPWENVQVERVDVAADDGQAEVAKLVAKFRWPERRSRRRGR